MTRDELFEIAKIIDNEYIGKEHVFSVSRKIGYWYLTTHKCDWCCAIKVWEQDGKIGSIERICCENGWQPITDYTKQRIHNLLSGNRWPYTKIDLGKAFDKLKQNL